MTKIYRTTDFLKTKFSTQNSIYTNNLIGGGMKSMGFGGRSNSSAYSFLKFFKIGILFFFLLFYQSVSALEINAPDEVEVFQLPEDVKLMWSCPFDECELQRKMDDLWVPLQVSSSNSGYHQLRVSEGSHRFRVLGCILTDNQNYAYRVYCSTGPTKTINAVKSYTDSSIFRLNFSTAKDREKISSHDNIDFVSTQGLEGGSVSNAAKVSYVPIEKGSERVTKGFELSDEVESATLSYDVKFDVDFEFVKGGKLHGLSGGYDNTGCKEVHDSGWSVRVNWSASGSPRLYIYHQDRESACGEGFAANIPFNFVKGMWHRVELYVEMNSGLEALDGKAVLYVDGLHLLTVDGLRLSGNSNVNIESFQFSTFHGGSTSAWSPSDTRYAYFKNFTVKAGFQLSGVDGKRCELSLNGIYNESGACCKDKCGSCGGAGCGALPGGSASCCTSAVLRNGQFCDSGESAPCSFD